MAVVCVTGARGFIGRHLTHALAARGHRVVGIGHGSWPEREALRWGVFDWLNADVRPESLRLLQRRHGRPAIVYHLAGGASVGAAIANPREDFARTVVTTAELLEWLRLDAPEAQLIVASSAAVYGAGHETAIAEDARLVPFSPYGVHKRVMEELCLSYAASYGQQVHVARLYSVYGAGLQKQLLWDLCTRIARAEHALELGGDGSELRDWIDVRDVVRALADCVPDLPPGSIVNVATGIGTSVRSVAESVCQAWSGHVGSASPILRFSGTARPGDPRQLVADTCLLDTRGFRPEVALARGLRDYVDWFRALSEANA